MACRLLTTIYSEPYEQRSWEMRLALLLNRAAFDSVRVLVDQEGMRSKFSTLIQSASHCAEGDLIVIANSDIVIPKNEIEAMDQSLKENQVYCLTRYELTTMQLFCDKRGKPVDYSQDAWAFRGPPKQNIVGDYYFGVPGCDNKFAYELHAAGYEVLNPSKSIRTYHLHASNKRTNTNTEKHRVPPPYFYIHPHEIGETPRWSIAETFDARRKAIRARRNIRVKVN